LTFNRYGRFTRKSSRQAIFCSVHQVRLLRCPMSVVKGSASDPRVIEQVDDLYGHSNIVEENINFALGWDRDFIHMMLAIEEIQYVIGRAITGEAPNTFTWGPLNAVNVLRVVHDVTSWALTNFEDFRARPAAEELPTFVRGVGAPYFSRSGRLQPPFDSNRPVRTLSCVNDPALRCPALWWAHVLLFECHRPCNRKQLGPPTRQWHLLRLRCPTGLHWLRERIAHWPSDYVRQHWTPLDSLLWAEA
jgi:hypothetical protein